MSNKSRIKVSFLMIFLILVSVFIYYNTFEEKVFFCGTPDIIDYPKLNDKQKEGRKLFMTLCASCHKLDKKLIGPALARDDWNFEYFLNYTIEEENLLKEKNVKALNINKEYNNFEYSHSFNQLSKEQIEFLFEYINKVDFN